jgi:hypothetical protein
MIKKARTKIASKVAKIEATDDFHFAKWLRPPKINAPEVKQLYYTEIYEGYEIEQFKTPNSVKLKFRLPSDPVITELKQKYLLDRPRALLIFFGLTRPQLFTLKENLLTVPQLTDYKSELPQIPEIIDYKSDLPQIPNVFNQSSQFIGDQADVLDKSDIYKFEETPSHDKSNIFLLNPQPGYKLDIDFTNLTVKQIYVDIDIPEITDELANLVPQVYNIELLNVEKLDTTVVDTVQVGVSEFSEPAIAKIDVPGIDDLLNSTVTSQYIQFDEVQAADILLYSPTLNIAHSVFKVKIDLPKTVIKKVVIKQKNLDPVVIDGFNDEHLPDTLKNDLKTILSSFRELTWEEFSKNLSGLSTYQLQSSEFLTANNFALVTDELGYEKFDQASAALSFLHKKGSARSVLFISELSRFNEYWVSSFKTYAREFKVKKIEPGTTKKIKGNYIWFIDINDLGKLEPKDFDKLDLVLFDELINIKASAELIDPIITKIEPAFIWILSPVNNDKAIKKLLDEFNFAQQVEFTKSGKSLSEIYEDNPAPIVKDIWLELDEMQLFEYDEAMTQAKAELNTLFDSLNPIKFQSSIFTIIHKLKQILNFSSFRNISPKANLLIEQIESIHKNKKKVIIFTQYDVNGMKKLEKALEMNNVKFVAGRNGMSTEELKQSMDTFYDRREISVYLTNLKASRLKINLNKIGYVINFDQWWNPVTLWQNDDEIGLNNVLTTPVVIYNYNIRNTFEEELLKLVQEKGFNNRYLFDNLKSEALSEYITPDDWLYVFGLNDQFKKILNSERSKIYTKLQTIELNAFKGLMKYFFSFLGYRDITVMDIDDEPMFYLIGTSKRGTSPVNLHTKCLLTSNIKKEDYEEVVHFKPGVNEIKRKFVITNGEFDERVTNGTMYIDGKDLANLVLTLGLKSHLTKKR